MMTHREQQTDMTCILRHVLLFAVIIARYLVTSCSFPDTLQMDPRDPPWYSHVRTDGSRDAEYYIRHNVMEIHFPKGERSNVRWKCVSTFHDKHLLKRQDHLVNNYYKCIKFIFRSRSIVQIMWSHEVKTFDLDLCDDLNLKLDPWPLIWYQTLDQDYTTCPFSGGFDMKILDSHLGENGCNLMLRPMRMEVECLGGEGVTFNFISSNCLPAVKMFVKQRTTCVTGWHDNKNHYVIIRRNDDINLWCLVMPIHSSSNMTAYLFSDLACVSDINKLQSITDIRYFTLTLLERVFSSHCEDEYEQCSKVICNAYVKQECQKSCRMCEKRSDPSECEFPTEYIGSWFLKDSTGHTVIDISASNITINGVGNFRCVSYPNSPTGLSTRHTTISMYQNGCRPRYTCIKLHRLGPSVLQYSLSQSYVWPTSEYDLGTAICHEDRFHQDSSPIDDLYRPYEGSGKPIIANIPNIKPVFCNLTYVYSINATFSKDGYACAGSLYKDCNDASKIRIDYKKCQNIKPSLVDYRCLANFEGHYWERILLIQNVLDEKDVICFVFSQFYPKEVYVLVASQCDQKSFSFARSGLRKPIIKLEVEQQQDSCISVPIITTTTRSFQIPPISSESSNPHGGHHVDTALSNLTGTDYGYFVPVSIVETGSLFSRTGHTPQINSFLDTKTGPAISSAKSNSLNDRNSLTSSSDSGAPALTPTSSFLYIFTVIVLLSRLVNIPCSYSLHQNKWHLKLHQHRGHVKFYQ